LGLRLFNAGLLYLLLTDQFLTLRTLDNLLSSVEFKKLMEQRPPLLPFNMESALKKVQAAEDAWNTRDPEKVCMAYTIDTEWRNRTDFINGRDEVEAFLTRKWQKELDYKLKKKLWGLSFEAMQNFTIDYRLNIANVPVPIVGQLHVIIRKASRGPNI
jgi:hypothetical protein